MMKIILIALAFIFLTVTILFSGNILSDIVSYLATHHIALGIILIALVVQFFGHFLRSMRTKLILDQAAQSSNRFQFGALSVGYLFNVILPFRVGELVRSLVIARRLHISLLYTFTAVVIERATDVVFLSLLVFVATVFLGGYTSTVLIVSVIALGTSCAILLCLYLLKNENRFLLKFISRFSQVFNTSISNSILFKTWSLIFGLQSFFRSKDQVRRYILYACVSWVCYFVSAALIVMAVLPVFSGTDLFLGGLIPYALPLTDLGVFGSQSYHQISMAITHIQTSGNIDLYAKLMWVTISLPIAFVGFVSLILYKKSKKTDSLAPSRNTAYINKLLRYDDISQDFPTFLETYFQGSTLTRILHKIEVNGGLSLVKFFKGGSDAITVLALQNGSMYVKKIVPIEYADRLRVQYLWLRKFAKKKAIVDVIAEHRNEEYYAIDLSYSPENISLFEYVHNHSLEQSTQIIDEVWRYVFENIYELKKEAVHNKNRDLYIQERLIDKVKKATMVNQDLRQVIESETITINGEQYDNFYTVINKIKSNKKAWGDLAVYRESTAIHGDLTIDNILVDTKVDEPVIIDPSDDNQIRGPIIDFARHTQSLIAGYEFLNADDEAVKASIDGDDIQINYHDRRSARYMELYDHLHSVVTENYLTETERRTILFHTGLLYGRMLAHRVYINPHNTLKYYAVCVVLLNEFYRQYDS